jgi:hypothetical protein
MDKSSIKPGVDYALREKGAVPSAFQRVRILEHIRGNKWKAEWIDPNLGLVHYVESARLYAPWKELKQYLREEENEARLNHENERSGYVKTPRSITPCPRCLRARATM